MRPALWLLLYSKGPRSGGCEPTNESVAALTMLRHAGTLADVFNDDAWVGVAHWQGTHKNKLQRQKKKMGVGGY